MPMRDKVTPVTSLPESPDERRASLGLDALPVPAVTVGGEGRILEANADAVALLTTDPLGRELDVVLPRGRTPGDAPGWRAELTDRAGVPFLVDVHLGPSVAGPRIASCCASPSRRC